MCKVSEKNVYWCLRYSSGQAKFKNILSIWANKNSNKSAVLNLIMKKLPRVYARIVGIVCVKHRKQFLLVFEIFLRTTKFKNILSIWANKNDDKSAILNLILKKLHRVNGRIVINACVKYRKPIFVSVEIFIWTDKTLKYFANFSKQKWW